MTEPQKTTHETTNTAADNATAVEETAAQPDTTHPTAPEAPPPGVPRGWYSDPTVPRQLRFWDGTGWTDHTAPQDAPAPAAYQPPPSPQSPGQSPGPRLDVCVRNGPAGTGLRRDELAFAWLLALLPLLWLPVDYFLPAASASYAAIAVGICLNGALATFDAKGLVKRGIDLTSLWGWLLVPVYLVQRTRRAGSTAFIPILWFASLALSVLGSLTFAASYEFDGAHEGDQIEAEIERQLGGEQARVQCPDRTVKDGDIFWCDLSSGEKPR